MHHQHERIVIYEDGADLTPDAVVREPAPANDTVPRLLAEEDGRAVLVEYVPPRRAA